MKTIKTTTTAILMTVAVSLAGQHDFDQTAYLYADEVSHTSENPNALNEDYHLIRKFESAMTVGAHALESADCETAADAYELAAKLSPESVEANFGAGISRYLSGNVESARLHFISALKLDPDHAQSHFGLARVQIQTGALRDVCEHLRYAVSGGLEEARTLMDRYCDETPDEAAGDYRDF